MQDLNLALFISEDELFAAISKYAATWRCNIPCSSLRDLILFPNNIVFYFFSCYPNLQFPKSHQSQHHCV